MAWRPDQTDGKQLPLPTDLANPHLLPLPLVAAVAAVLSAASAQQTRDPPETPAKQVGPSAAYRSGGGRDFPVDPHSPATALMPPWGVHTNLSQSRSDRHRLARDRHRAPSLHLAGLQQPGRVAIHGQGGPVGEPLDQGAEGVASARSIDRHCVIREVPLSAEPAATSEGPPLRPRQQAGGTLDAGVCSSAWKGHGRLFLELQRLRLTGEKLLAVLASAAMPCCSTFGPNQ